jgi:hypothetical protein
MSYLDPPAEYVRAWKLFSLLCRFSILLIGARCLGLPDWDVTVSFVMAVSAYLTAPCILGVVLERRWKQLLWLCSGRGSPSMGRTASTGTSLTLLH